MSVIRLTVPDRDRIPPGAIDRVYMTGMDGVPWQCRSAWENDHLVVRRGVQDSGYLYVTWRLPGGGDLVLSTSTVMARERPYLLPVELARGTLNRLRNQRAAWEMAGLVVSADVDQSMTDATRTLVTATTSQHDVARAAQAAESSVGFALDGITRLGQLYTDQALSIRHASTPKLSTFYASNLGTTIPGEKGTRLLTRSFNAAVVPMCWSRLEPNSGVPDWRLTDAQLQWCRQSGLKSCGGPLLTLDRWSLPDWLFLWEDDHDQVQHHIRRHIEAVVQRYQGQVHVWHAASGTNVTDALDLGEELRLRLTVAAIEVIRRIDPKTPVIVSFDQPWAEYMGREPHDLAPLHFADALVRAELGMAGIGLEINLGYAPGGTLPRDLLDISLQIDRWAMLGMPLVVGITAPSSAAEDPQAGRKVTALSNGSPEGPSPASQRLTAHKIVPLLLAKQCVQGIIWNQLLDTAPHAFPHGGLFDAAGQAKPALQVLGDIRQQHLL